MAGRATRALGGITGALIALTAHPCLLYFAKSFGAVAQLGERHAGSVEVTGSIPVGSILMACGEPEVETRAFRPLKSIFSRFCCAPMPILIVKEIGLTPL